MSKIKVKTITCCLCDREVDLTEGCQKLFSRDVCPECAARVLKLANKWSQEANTEKEG